MWTIGGCPPCWLDLLNCRPAPSGQLQSYHISPLRAPGWPSLLARHPLGLCALGLARALPLVAVEVGEVALVAVDAAYPGPLAIQRPPALPWAALSPFWAAPRPLRAIPAPCLSDLHRLLPVCEAPLPWGPGPWRTAEDPSLRPPTMARCRTRSRRRPAPLTSLRQRLPAARRAAQAPGAPGPPWVPRAPLALALHGPGPWPRAVAPSLASPTARSRRRPRKAPRCAIPALDSEGLCLLMALQAPVLQELESPLIVEVLPPRPPAMAKCRIRPQ
mmetsp:Transcript_119100/g.332305  ORF Transcript_119100/g.332305 Transcript_119100/m.332305 type:complete len:274 (+) Transcript_119100:625-1446(+)